MFQLSHVFLLGLLFGMAIAHKHQQVPAKHQNRDDGSSACAGANQNTAKYRLCRDFRDLRDLIPANTLVYLTTKHYKSDKSFQRAMEFVQTPEFASVSLQIAESDVYQQALDQLDDAGVNTAVVANISNIFNCLMLPMPEYSDEEEINDTMQKWIIPRSLQSFANELKAAIPRTEFKRLVAEKIAKSSQFAAFYRLARSTGFRNQVKNGFKSYELQYPLSVLKRNGIDLCELAKTVFEILSWGPAHW